jgi:hypothetical protein
MSFARVTVNAAAVLIFCCAAATAGGPNRPFQAGLWSGGAYTDDRTGGFSHCSAGVAYDSGINLFVVGTEAHGWWLGFWSPQWSFAPNSSLPVKLKFDGRPPVDLQGTVAAGQTLLVALPEEGRLPERFQRSSQLNVTAQERSFSLHLGGTSNVIAELTNCIRNSLALEPHTPASPPEQAAPGSEAAEGHPPSAPAATQAPRTTALEMPPPSPPPLPAASGPLEARPVTAPATPVYSAPSEVIRPAATRSMPELEEVRLARNFLLAARLPNARLIETGKPAALARFSGVWRSDDAAGAVEVIPPRPDMTGIGIASGLITVNPQLCKGNFASARSSEMIEGGIVIWAALSCADAQNELTTQYFIAPRPKGGFVVFAVIANASASGGPGSDGKRVETFKKAAIQAVSPGD